MTAILIDDSLQPCFSAKRCFGQRERWFRRNDEVAGVESRKLAFRRSTNATASRHVVPTFPTGVLYVFVLINNRGVLEKSSTGLIFQRKFVYVFVLINNRGALLLSLYLFPILIREIREIRGLITSNHMEWYGCGTLRMHAHNSGPAMSYLCTRNQEENKMPIFGQQEPNLIPGRYES